MKALVQVSVLFATITVASGKLPEVICAPNIANGGDPCFRGEAHHD